MKNIAIVGTGGIASQHIESYRHFADRSRILALCDIDPTKTAARAAEYGLKDARLYTDYQEMLADPALELDIVSITTPPFTHRDIAVAALDSGRHVLVEKPMAPSVAECDDMLDAAHRNHRVCASVAQNRFATPMARQQAVVASGLAGRPLYVLAESVWWRGAEYYDMWWRGTWEKEVGGCTLNVGVHQLDQLLWIMGMPSEVTSIAANLAHGNAEVEDISMTLLRFPSGAVGEFNCSNFHHGEERQILVQCEKAGVWSPWHIRANLPGPGGFPVPDKDTEQALQAFGDQVPPQRHASLFFCQIENFLDHIDGVSPLRADGEDGRKAIEVVSAIYKSAFTGQTVSLPLQPDDPFYSRKGVMEQAVRYHEKIAKGV